MAQEALNLFQGHPALECQAGSGVPENVRRDMTGDVTPAEDLGDLILHGLDLQPVMRRPAADKQGGVVIVPGGQVGAEGNLRFRVQECGTAFAAFAALNMDSMILPVDVIQVESAEFRHPAGGGIQEVNNRLFTEGFTHTADRFELQSRHREAFRTIHPDSRHTADGVFRDKVLLDAPLEEGIDTDPHAFQGGVLHGTVLFIMIEVNADVIRINLFKRLVHGSEELRQPEQGTD